MSGVIQPSVIPTYEQLVYQASLPTRHSPIGFSKTETWWNCPPSVRLSIGKPRLTSEFALEGIIAHLVAACRLEHGVWPEGTPLVMRQNLQIYVDTVSSYILQTYASASQVRLMVEQKFELLSVHRNARGTADVAIYRAPDETLVVIDLKYGEGEAVEVGTVEHPNKQLTAYGLGALVDLRVPAKWLRIVVVQPRREHRLGPVRDLLLPIRRVIDFAQELAEHARETDNPDALIAAGKHCRFCDASPDCDAGRQFLTALAAQESVVPVDPEKLARALDLIQRFEPWAASVKRVALGEALAGRPVPGYKMTDRDPRRHHRDEARTRAVLGMDYDLSPDAFYSKEMKSPAQVEKLIPRKDWPKYKGLWVSRSSGVKLVPESDPGEPKQLSPGAPFGDVDEKALNDF